jgi:hypothetical protein
MRLWSCSHCWLSYRPLAQRSLTRCWPRSWRCAPWSSRPKLHGVALNAYVQQQRRRGPCGNHRSRAPAEGGGSYPTPHTKNISTCMHNYNRLHRRQQSGLADLRSTPKHRGGGGGRAWGGGRRTYAYFGRAPMDASTRWNSEDEMRTADCMAEGRGRGRGAHQLTCGWVGQGTAGADGAEHTRRSW